MLVRIVRMTFAPDHVGPFLDLFEDRAPQIRAVPGCRRLALWRDADVPRTFATHSHWEDAEALTRYRESDFFRSTWRRVKPLFSEAPVAHSYRIARSAARIDEGLGE